MPSRLWRWALLLSFLFCLPSWADGPGLATEAQQYVLRSEITTTRLVDGKEAVRRAIPTMLVKNGERATFSLTPSKEATYEVRSRYVISSKGANKIRLDFEISTRVAREPGHGESPWLTSQVSSTVLEGETWETSLEEPRSGCHTNIVVTIWSVPPRHKFSRFDEQHRPVFERR